MALAFLEAYFDRLEGAMAVQVWSTFLTFVREVLNNLTANRPLVFPSLRYVIQPFDFATLRLTLTPDSGALPGCRRKSLRQALSRIDECDEICKRRSFDS